jgi:tRNA(Ile)-lysidine synthase
VRAPKVTVDPESILGRVRRFIASRRLLEEGPLVVAVSGGQDSVCMLDLLAGLRTDLGLELHVAHLNHMLRGAEAQAEAEQLRDLATRMGLPATIGSIDVPAYRARHHLSEEVAARYARYQFLAAVAGRVGSRRLAVGHTADDSAETLLLNLLRGAGLAGLRGILPTREMMPAQLGPRLEESDWKSERLELPAGPLPTVVRPILELSRAETEGYCRARGLDFRVDPSNLDLSYRRNWIRGELLPLMNRRVPGATDRLRNAADLLADDYAVVVSHVGALWRELARVSEDRVEFDLGPWLQLETSVQRHLLRRAVALVAGSLEDFGRVHVDGCEAVIRLGHVGAVFDLPGRFRLEKGYTTFWLRGPVAPWAGPGQLPAEPMPLPLPGVATWQGGSIEASLLQVEHREVAGEGQGKLLPEGCSGSRWEACLDADRVRGPLVVRRRRPGDSFVPLGMGRPKKLQDFLVDLKVPRGDRDNVPIVAAVDAIIWVAGYRIDDRFKVTPATERVLRLHYQSEP